MPTLLLISDTHGKLPPDHDALVAGADYLIHAGDIGSDAILDRLSGPDAFLIGGNIDKSGRCGELPERSEVEVFGLRVCVVHAINPALASLKDSNYDLVVHGHSHRPALVRDAAQMRINPGSYAYPRFGVPASYVELGVDAGTIVDVRFRVLT